MTFQSAPSESGAAKSVLPEATRFKYNRSTATTTFPADLPENPDIPKPVFPGMAERYNREVIDAYVAAVKSPDDAEKVGELGMLFHRLSSVTEAVKCFTRAAKLAPKSMRWHYYLAIANEASYDAPAALQALKVAQAIEPNYPGVPLKMGDVTRTSDAKTARKHYEQALKLFPNDARILFGLGQCDLLEGKKDNAVENFQRAVSLAPRFAGAHRELANYYAEKGDKKEADVHQTLAEQGGLPPVVADPLYIDLISRLVSSEALLNLTKQLVDTGYGNQAVEILQRGVKFDPTDWVLHQQLGVALIGLGRFEEAAAELRLVVDEDPGRPRARSFLAQALVELGRYQEAEKLFKTAIQLAPDDWETASRYADMLLTTGHGKEAEELYGRLVRSDPGRLTNHLGLIAAQVCEKKITQAARGFQGLLVGTRGGGADMTNALIAQLAMVVGEQRRPDATSYRQSTLAESVFETLADQLADLGMAAEARKARLYVDTLARNVVTLAERGEFLQAFRLMQRVIHMDQGGVLRDAFRTAYLVMRKKNAASADKFIRETAAQAPNIPALANAVAWTLSTCPEASQRDGPTALKLATAACAATKSADPEYLDTLAAAYAEVGQFDDAARAGQQAIQIASARNASGAVEKYRARLSLYEAKKPYHANP